jgi:hypothetical protein
VEVTYFSSKSRHTLTLEQDGNRLRGSHQGDFSSRDVSGTIEGDQIKLQSTDYKPGDSITYTFAGSLAGDTFSGPVYMGEYLNAKFSAKRHAYQERRGTIMIPGGPPLAN